MRLISAQVIAILRSNSPEGQNFSKSEPGTSRGLLKKKLNYK